MNLYQGYYRGEKLGNPRTEKEKNQVQACFTDILWAVIPQHRGEGVNK